MNEIKIPFSGGDNLTGILKLYNNILMANELDNGYGAYEISLASPDSGLSFGGNQMDMSEESEARLLFLDIMENAVDSINQKFFCDDEIVDICLNIKNKGRSPEKVFGNYLFRVNEALSSEYGIAKINEQYVKEISIDYNHIENVILNITDSIARTFYNTTIGRLLLFDYNNQFYLAPHGELKIYMDGYKVITYTGKALIVGDSYNIDNHKEFLFETEYGVKHKPDVLRRINNIFRMGVFADGETNL